MKVVIQGIERFKREDCDLIIINTSGQHSNKDTLSEEMCQLYEATVYSSYHYHHNIVTFVYSS